ncbi:MAG TPA: hypothetical protein VFA63_17235 [Pseudonocardiaceae bacterium]|jgi:hypothetical protein|nr:hypothetical protein [Pseudonocardiaceae bacterium]
MSPADVPVPVRAAGGLVLLQGLTGVAAGGWLLIAALRGSTGPVPIAATAAWLVGFGAILLTVGVTLIRGRHGARTPAIVAQLLLLGVCWYAIGPSSQPLYGVLAGALCLVVLILLFCASARRWAAEAHSATR